MVCRSNLVDDDNSVLANCAIPPPQYTNSGLTSRHSIDHGFVVNSQLSSVIPKSQSVIQIGPSRASDNSKPIYQVVKRNAQDNGLNGTHHPLLKSQAVIEEVQLSLLYNEL